MMMVRRFRAGWPGLRCLAGCRRALPRGDLLQKAAPDPAPGPAVVSRGSRRGSSPPVVLVGARPPVVLSTRAFVADDLVMMPLFRPGRSLGLVLGGQFARGRAGLLLPGWVRSE